jgi:hypothetical protein
MNYQPNTKLLFIVFTIVLISCTSSDRRARFLPVEGIDFKFGYVDEMANNRIRVSITSLSNENICLGREGWPYATEQYTDSVFSSGVYLVVSGQIFQYQSVDMLGYCRDEGCFRPVVYGETVDGYFGYSRFGLGEEYYKEDKVLKFAPVPYWCIDRLY